MSLYSTLGAEGNHAGRRPPSTRGSSAATGRSSRTTSSIGNPAASTVPASRCARCRHSSRSPDGGDELRAPPSMTLCNEAESRMRSREGVNLIVLSDRGVSPADLAPIPDAAWRRGAVHHQLVREELRTQCGLVCETGEARDVAQFALLDRLRRWSHQSVSRI